MYCSAEYGVEQTLWHVITGSPQRGPGAEPWLGSEAKPQKLEKHVEYSTEQWTSRVVRCRTGLATARSWVRILQTAAVYQRQLSVPSLLGRLMSISLRAIGWELSAADCGGGMSAVLRRGSTCPLSRALDGCIPRCGTISSCRSAATSKIVKRVFSCNV